MSKLSKKQKEIYIWIKNFIIDNGKSPIYQEIGDAFGIRSTNCIAQHLNALRKKGFIDWDKHTPRSIRITKEVFAKKGIPVIGRVPAGTLSEAIQDYDETLDLSGFFSKERTFALKVYGDSMIDAGILDGDFVIVKPSPVVDNGTIGVVEINDEATVKYIYIKKNEVLLKPANKSFKKMVFDIRDGNIRIDGPVIGVFRLLDESYSLKRSIN